MTFKMPLFLFVSVCLLFFAGSASAHDEQPRLEIPGGTAGPGSTVEIRGVGFGFEEQITLALAGLAMDMHLGTISADTEGGFQLTINLPLDLAPGTYDIRAWTDDHEVRSVEFRVEGIATPEGEGEGLRDEDDGLLAPMPTQLPGFTSTPISETSPRTEDPSAAKDRSLIPWFVIGAGFLVLIGIGRRIKV